MIWHTKGSGILWYQSSKVSIIHVETKPGKLSIHLAMVGEKLKSGIMSRPSLSFANVIVKAAMIDTVSMRNESLARAAPGQDLVGISSQILRCLDG